MILDDLFPFPIVMVDGHNEDRKVERNQRLGISDDDDPEVDIIEGTAECAYYDFISVTDRWLPNDQSLDAALGGKFEACYVQFKEGGSYVVPWSREHFKKKFREFVEGRSPVKKTTRKTNGELSE
jgi:hypothetical protein